MPGIRELRQTAPNRGSLRHPIPTIDASLLKGDFSERKVAIQQIRSACLDTGFFGVDQLLDGSACAAAVLRQMERFFALPATDPRKKDIDVSERNDTNGWMPMYREPAYQPGTVAHLESFDCGRPAAHPEDKSQPNNRWPDIPGFRADVEALWANLSDTGFELMRGIGEAFGLDAQFLTDRCHTQDLSTLRLLHYPPMDATDADDANVGISAHTDFECITVIVQTAPGLELMNVDGDWHDAPTDENKVVVLLGDMLERWTNGTLKATGHRVRHRQFQRYSVVLFFAVNDGIRVAPLENFVSATNPVRYPPTDQSSHTADELSRAEANRNNFENDR